MTKSPWKHFTLDELKCKCATCGSTGLEMKTELMEPIEILRERLGFPFVVTSGFRCASWNKAKGGTEMSAHMRGEALDINIYYGKAYKLLEEAFKLKAFMGIGINQCDGLHGRFLHLDILPRKSPVIWSY